MCWWSDLASVPIGVPRITAGMAIVVSRYYQANKRLISIDAGTGLQASRQHSTTKWQIWDMAGL